MSRSSYVHMAAMLQVLVFFCVVQSQPVYAKSLPFYEGLVLSYRRRASWKSPLFGEGEFGGEGNIAIKVLENDGEMVKLDYDASYRIILPPRSYLTINAVNFDKSEAKFRSDKESYSVHSVLTLKDRTTVNIAGDRAEYVRLNAMMTGGGWAETTGVTEVPLGYSTWLFIPAGASPRDRIPTFSTSGASIGNGSITLDSTQTLSTLFGNLETVRAHYTYENTVSQGIWRGNFTYYYSRSTGILLEYRSYSRLSRTSGEGGEESHQNSFVLVGIDKAQSRLSIDSMPSEVNVNSQIKASGRMYPAVGGKTLDVTAKPDAGTEISSRVTTSQDGTFTATLTPTTAGSWTLRINYAGDLTTKPSSVEKRFQVIGPRQTTTTFSTTETKTPAPDLSIVAVVAVVVLAAIIGIVVLRKGKKDTPYVARARGPTAEASQITTMVPPTPSQAPPTPKPKVPETENRAPVAGGVKYCVHCGAIIPDAVIFCTKCGKKQ